VAHKHHRAVFASACAAHDRSDAVAEGVVRHPLARDAAAGEVVLEELANSVDARLVVTARVDVHRIP
jgi:hypothetical protein